MENIQAMIEERIAALASDVMNAVRATAMESLSGALGGQTTSAKGRRPQLPKRKSRKRSVLPRRTSEEFAELRERLYEQIEAAPGETMSVYSKRLNMPSAELALVARKLRKSDRVRKVGERSDTRYFPMGPA